MPSHRFRGPARLPEQNFGVSRNEEIRHGDRPLYTPGTIETRGAPSLSLIRRRTGSGLIKVSDSMCDSKRLPNPRPVAVGEMPSGSNNRRRGIFCVRWRCRVPRPSPSRTNVIPGRRGAKRCVSQRRKAELPLPRIRAGQDGDHGIAIFRPHLANQCGRSSVGCIAGDPTGHRA